MNGETFVVDMQHHFIPAEALKLVGKTEEHDFTYGLKRFKKEYAQMVDVQEHLNWMDDSGIDMAILSTSSFIPNGQDFCRACNDGYAEVTKSHPDRFKGMIHVSPFANEAQNRDEIKRTIDTYKTLNS